MKTKLFLFILLAVSWAASIQALVGKNNSINEFLLFIKISCLNEDAFRKFKLEGSLSEMISKF